MILTNESISSLQGSIVTEEDLIENVILCNKPSQGENNDSIQDPIEKGKSSNSKEISDIEEYNDGNQFSILKSNICESSDSILN